MSGAGYQHHQHQQQHNSQPYPGSAASGYGAAAAGAPTSGGWLATAAAGQPPPPSASASAMTIGGASGSDNVARLRDGKASRHRKRAATNEDIAAEYEDYGDDDGFTPAMRDLQARGKDPYDDDDEPATKALLDLERGRLFQESFPKVERRAFAASVLDSPELLMMYAQNSGDKSIPATRLRFMRILCGFEEQEEHRRDADEAALASAGERDGGAQQQERHRRRHRSDRSSGAGATTSSSSARKASGSGQR